MSSFVSSDIAADKFKAREELQHEQHVEALRYELGGLSLAALRDRAHAAGVSTKALDDVEVGWRGMSHDDEVSPTACRRLFSLGCVLTLVGLCRRGR